MNNELVLSNKYQRRIFFILGISVCLTIFLIRYFALPTVIEDTKLLNLINPVLDGLFVSAISGLSITGILAYITPPQYLEGAFSLIHPREVKNQLSEIRTNCIEYAYIGHIGRWTRSVTVRSLAKNAKRDNTHIKITMIVLDPSDIKLCQNYAEYRRGVSSSSNSGLCNLSKVRIEILASICAMLNWKSKESLLDIGIRLTNNFSVFRYDYSDKGLVITTQDSRSPSIYCGKKSLQFRNYRYDIEIQKKFAKPIPVLKVFSDLVSFKNNAKKIRAEFLKLNIKLFDLTESEIFNIIDLAIESKDPYSA